MNALLLPFVNFNEAGIDLDEPYVGVYNFDMNNIQSIEPNENGQTVVNHKYGNPITFAVDTMEFLNMQYFFTENIFTEITFL